MYVLFPVCYLKLVQAVKHLCNIYKQGLVPKKNLYFGNVIKKSILSNPDLMSFIVFIN